MISYWITLSIGFVIFVVSGQYQLLETSIFAPHDSFYPVTNSILQSSFALFNSADDFTKNFVPYYLHIPDRIYLKTLFMLGFTPKMIQLFHVVSCYFLLLTGTYFAFSRIFTSKKLLILATLAYCFSPLMAIFYSSGIFYSISTVVALFIIPLFINSLLDLSKKHNIWIVSCSIFVFAANLMFLLPAIILLVGSILYHYRVVTVVWFRSFPKGIFISISISLIPILLFIWLNSQVPEVQKWTSGSTASAIEGSLFYPLMQIVSWAIYNPWEPRAILKFSDFFFSPGFKFLSISIIFFLIIYLVTIKKYLIIFLIMLAAFFAKGPSFPLGEIYSFIVEKIPFGYMIRNPDIKFAALISALILIGAAYLPKFNQKIVAVLIGAFLCINLYGIYFNGAISAQQGGHLATSYIYADDYKEVVNLINQKKNSLVISPFQKCSGEYYQDKFHTCNDLLISNLERQVIQKNFESFGDLVVRYQSFSTFVYFNKNKTTYRKELEAFKKLKMSAGYEIVYDSNNYTLYLRESEFPSCDDKYQYACVKTNNGYVYSIPWFYFEYLSNKAAYSIENELVQTNQKLIIHKNLWPIVLEWTYMLSLVLNLILLYRNVRVRA